MGVDGGPVGMPADEVVPLPRLANRSLVAGTIDSNRELILESLMPEGGAIFSDGIEDDYLEFNSGSTVHISLAAQQANLVVP